MKVKLNLLPTSLCDKARDISDEPSILTAAVTWREYLSRQRTPAPQRHHYLWSAIAISGKRSRRVAWRVIVGTGRNAASLSPHRGARARRRCGPGHRRTRDLRRDVSSLAFGTFVVGSSLRNGWTRWLQPLITTNTYGCNTNYRIKDIGRVPDRTKIHLN